MITHCLILLWCGFGAVLNFEEIGGVPEDDSEVTEFANAALLNKTLNALKPGDTFLVPNKTFHVMGGVFASGFHDVTLQFDGTIALSQRIKKWPRSGDGKHAPVMMCFKLENVENVTITSSGKGTFDGNGAVWWGIPGVGYLVRSENRPKLFVISHGKNILMENMLFKNSPYWTVDLTVDNMEIRNCDVSNRRTSKDGHSVLDLTAFNTDGFDVRGNNVWIHDCNIWNQDDCIAVKGQASNMVFERINASGLGLTIGSMGDQEYAKNITFRDCYMHKTWKGIYIKFRDIPSGGSVIENILYENIVIDEPEQHSIWIGPAQQSDTRKFCAAHPCSICWPADPFATCDAPARGSFRNITLKNIRINNPKKSPGLIFANSTNQMENIVFDGVIVNNPAKTPWKDYYYCKGVENGIARGGTDPVPPCFKSEV